MKNGKLSEEKSTRSWAVWVACWLVALVVIAAVHPSPLAPETAAQFWAHNDGANLREGYNSITSARDTLKWWHGSWEHNGSPAYRPLSAYLYLTQIRVGEYFGFQWAHVITTLLFSLYAALCGVLCYQLTQSRPAAVGAAFLAALFTFQPPAGETHWLRWWAMSDNLLAACFMVTALIGLVAWLRGSRLGLAVFGVLAVSAMLSKETAYAVGLMGAALVCYFPARKLTSGETRNALLVSLVPLIVMFVLRKLFISDAGASRNGLFALLHLDAWQHLSTLGFSLALWQLIENPLPYLQSLALVACGMGSGYALIRYRRPSWLMCGVLLIGTLPLTTIGLIPWGRFLLPAWATGAILLPSGCRALWLYCKPLNGSAASVVTSADVSARAQTRNAATLPTNGVAPSRVSR